MGLRDTVRFTRWRSVLRVLVAQAIFTDEEEWETRVTSETFFHRTQFPSRPDLDMTLWEMKDYGILDMRDEDDTTIYTLHIVGVVCESVREAVDTIRGWSVEEGVEYITQALQ